MPNHQKKLIEVALPLGDINTASAREKSIKHGHPSTLHLWWARRPLAAARAVLFGQLVDDPSGYIDELWGDKDAIKKAEKVLGRKIKPSTRDENLDKLLIEQERERLFNLIRQLVLWENTTNESVLEPCREEIRKSWRRTCRREGKPEDTPMPPFLDPFAGGGAIPLEAQRLGLEAYASDLNPVAVLINKAMIEIPPKFTNQSPSNPEWLNKSDQEKIGTAWEGSKGLAEDIMYYGKWMRDEAFKRISHLYPPYKLTQELINSRPDIKKAGYEDGDELTVMAWLWARTAPSPNPALNGKRVPLVSSFNLSTTKGKEAWVRPIIENNNYRFEICIGKPIEPEKTKAGTKTGRGANFGCILSGVPIPADYVKAEGMAGRMGWKLLAVVAEGKGRIFLPPSNEQENAFESTETQWEPSGKLSTHPQYMSCTNYGPTDVKDLFMKRQALALSTFSDVLDGFNDFFKKNSALNSKALEEYALALKTYLAMGISRLANRQSTNTFWDSIRQTIQQVFARHALPFVWDTAEGNPFSDSSGNFLGQLKYLANVVKVMPCHSQGKAAQIDARVAKVEGHIISTDPPYYDNVPYADLSDFFYVWLRRSLKDNYPDLFGTILVPKMEELVADNKRHNGKKEAENFFLDGMTEVITRLAKESHKGFPMTIYYAFRHSEKKAEGIITSGWETFLSAIINSGYGIVGTWPMRTELVGNLKKKSNALASSIVLVCRQRPDDAPIATRREFVQALQREIPTALNNLQQGNIAPVDLPQSSIGPGMEIFSRYNKIIEPDGSSMAVRIALQLINQVVEEYLTEQESQMDDWTRFAVIWFSQFAFKSGPAGDALNIATAKNVSLDGVVEAGIIQSGGGYVRILGINELPEDWDPSTDNRLTIWEIVHHLSKALDQKGTDGASALLKKVGGLAEDAKSLCYRLYNICEQNKWAEEAQIYNNLITEWPNMAIVSSNIQTTPTQTQSEWEM